MYDKCAGWQGAIARLSARARHREREKNRGLRLIRTAVAGQNQLKIPCRRYCHIRSGLLRFQAALTTH